MKVTSKDWFCLIGPETLNLMMVDIITKLNEMNPATAVRIAESWNKHVDAWEAKNAESSVG